MSFENAIQVVIVVELYFVILCLSAIRHWIKQLASRKNEQV